VTIVDDFDLYRKRMNDRILQFDNLAVKRFFNLDANVYKDGVLDSKTKEMIGLVASMVMRCDDCVRYHIQQCRALGTTEEEFFEIFGVALVVGGSIVVPHMRRAVEFLDAVNGK